MEVLNIAKYNPALYRMYRHHSQGHPFNLVRTHTQMPTAEQVQGVYVSWEAALSVPVDHMMYTHTLNQKRVDKTESTFRQQRFSHNTKPSM